MNLLEINVVLALISLMAASFVSFWQGEWAASLAALPIERLSVMARRTQWQGRCLHANQQLPVRTVAALAQMVDVDFDGKQHWRVHYSDEPQIHISRQQPMPPIEAAALELRGARQVGQLLVFRLAVSDRSLSPRMRFLHLQQGGC